MHTRHRCRGKARLDCCLSRQVGARNLLGLDGSILCGAKRVLSLLLDLPGTVSLVVEVTPGAVGLVDALVGVSGDAVCCIICAASRRRSCNDAYKG